ncbi:MAG: AIR synthase related protein [Chloroflexota bacterium]|nr:AIR synthase related protein [Chloroflexota bacterium]
MATEPLPAALEAYAAAGVDYELLDPSKRLAQHGAASTTAHLARHGASEVPGTRGESAYIIDLGDHYLATLTEGLGTKSLVADAVRALTGRSHYDAVARDTVATILNDLATVGAAPLVVSAYWAAGASEWFADAPRTADLVRGWTGACAEAGATWGGGETQAVAGVVVPGAATLAGAAVGIIRPKGRLLLGERVATGDAILVAPATGIHANGLTLARRLAATLPQGYATPLPDDPHGRSYGEVLLDPAPLYGPLVEALLDAGVEVHYAVHVTGHGWRKLMRSALALTYVVDRLPEVPPVLAFLRAHAGMSEAEAYGTFNMGAGFALYLPAAEVARAQGVAAARGTSLQHVGTVEPGPRRVVLRPLHVTYDDASLRLR